MFDIEPILDHILFSFVMRLATSHTGLSLLGLERLENLVVCRSLFEDNFFSLCKHLKRWHVYE